MSALYFGAEVKTTKRYELGRQLGDVTGHLLLMTATPHAGSRRTSTCSYSYWITTASRAGRGRG
jgi:hypothetical protein